MILAGLAASLFWLIEPIQGASWIWIGRIGCSFVVVVSAAVLIWAKTRKSKAPDFLMEVCSSYFERNGFCFAIVPQVVGGHCQLSIYYQNRYERQCEGLVWIVPTNVAFKDVSSLPKFELKIRFTGGEFGRMFCVCNLPLVFKGESILWNVAAKSKYPNGRGQLLRLRDGLRVGTEAKISAGRELLRFVGALGHFHSETPARITIQFPEEVFTGNHIGAWEQETIWKLHRSKNGLKSVSPSFDGYSFLRNAAISATLMF